MLRCLMDMAIPEDSKCAKCCLHCNEKETCEHRCYGVDLWITEDVIVKNCDLCYEED